MIRLLVLFLGIALSTSAFAQGISKAVVKKFDNGKPEMINHYKGDKTPENLVKQETLNLDGKVLLEKNFLDMKLHGPYKEFKEFDGSIEKELNYANGVLDGEQKYYYSDGRVKMSLNYAAGKLSGEQREYLFKTDTIGAEHNYSGGVLHGMQRRWNKDLTQDYHYNFVAGKPEGIQRHWEGEKMIQEKWVQGMLTEEVENWTASQPKHVRVYSFVNTGDSLNLVLGRKLERETMYYESGAISAMMEPGDPPSIKELHPNGKVKGEGKGTFAKREGQWVWYHVNGKKMRQGEYKNGKPMGVFQTWDEKERLIEEVVWDENGEQRVSWTVFGYHWDDKKAFEGSLTPEGWKTGLWKFWFENGNRHKEETWKSECKGSKARPTLVNYTEWTPAGKLLLEGNERQMVETAYYDGGAKKSESVKLFVLRDPCSQPQPEQFVEGRFERRADNAGSYAKFVITDIFHFTENGDSLLHERFDQEGKRHGYQDGWYPNGQKQFSYHYLHGRVQGSVLEWYENGQPMIDHKYQSAVGGPANLVEGIFYNDKGKDYTYLDSDGKEMKKSMLEVEALANYPKFFREHPNE